MARIVLNGTIVKYPLGGMNLWFMAHVVGLKRLGHDVYFVEKSMWEYSCFDVSKKIMTSDPSYGLGVITAIMKKYDLEDHWCYVDHKNRYHGLSKKRITDIFRSADILVDMEWGEWADEAAGVPKTVLIDGEAAWLQMKLMNLLASGGEVPKYDLYLTQGMNIGRENCSVPLAGITWQHCLSPLLPDDSLDTSYDEDAPFTTIMNWKSNKEIEYQGKKYGQKGIEFEKFMDLPSHTTQALEVAASGPTVPRQRLQESGWRVKDADQVAQSSTSYLTYIAKSKGEFGVAKNVFVETLVGHLTDRSGYYLYYGKPVVQQETGFSEHVPCGLGLFAVKNRDEAAAAIETIRHDYKKHSKAAKEIARAHFSGDSLFNLITA